MGITDVWDDINFYEKNRIHPTQKPYKLIERLILASSNENDLVLDPFSGSGTTALVARQLNRNFIGIEIDEEYKQSSEERLERVLIN
jgi:DNA modification methylase